MRAHDNMATVSASHQPVEAERLLVAAEVLGLLADPTRLQLLLLATGEQDVTTLAGQVTASRSSVSQHLGRLRLAGLVQARGRAADAVPHDQRSPVGAGGRGAGVRRSHRAGYPAPPAGR
jgi:hypothetical protein